MANLLRPHEKHLMLSAPQRGLDASSLSCGRGRGEGEPLCGVSCIFVPSVLGQGWRLCPRRLSHWTTLATCVGYLSYLSWISLILLSAAVFSSAVALASFSSTMAFLRMLES